MKQNRRRIERPRQVRYREHLWNLEIRRGELRRKRDSALVDFGCNCGAGAVSPHVRGERRGILSVHMERNGIRGVGNGCFNLAGADR